MQIDKSETPAEDTRALDDLIDTAFDDDTPSITQVNGTVARFGMSYAPPGADRHVFHAPLAQLAPAIAYAALAVTAFVFVFAIHAGDGAGPLHQFIVDGDQGRALASRPFVTLLLASAVATLVRAWLRGVVVTCEGIEARELGTFAIPRVKRWSWVQIDRLVIDSERGRVLLELWNGSRAVLPAVRDGDRLGDLLRGVGVEHKKDVTLLSA